MEPISDDELQRLRDFLQDQLFTDNDLQNARRWKLHQLHGVLPQIIATIERQRADLSAKQQRIERLEDKLDAWNDLYGSDDWRSVLAAEMELEEPST